MNINYKTIFGGILATSSLIALGIYAIDTKSRIDERKAQIEAIQDGIEVEIDEGVVENAIHQSIKRQVDAKVETQVIKAVRLINDDIYKKVSKEIYDSRQSIDKQVKKEIEHQIKDLDISSIKREVIESAKERAIEKFDDDLDEVLDKHNRELENISKVYQAIAKSLDNAKGANND